MIMAAAGCRPQRRACNDDRMTYLAADSRYSSMTYRRTGRSGLLLPALSLGLWHNFGDDKPLEVQRDILRRAFDLGITHFDLANNYGPPYGAAERNFGGHFASDFRPYRDELIISTKAGYDMWPGPYGDGGSRKYLLASSRPVAWRGWAWTTSTSSTATASIPTPRCEETVGALASAVRRARRSTSASPPTPPSARAEAASMLAAGWACRCSSTSPRTRC